MKVGLDLIEIERIHEALERYPRWIAASPRPSRSTDSRANPAQHYAARFAGKEAVGKALGVGVARAFAWKEVEITDAPSRRSGSGKIEDGPSASAPARLTCR